MSFLLPGFLFAMVVVAIPVIVHLFNFRKVKRVYFSNVSFLKEIQQESASSRKVKRRLLLIIRMLALTFLVLAFARPYLPSGRSGATGSNQVVSFYIDNSYSMELLNKEGSLLDEAKRRAKEIASVYGINDKFQLLTNDFEGKHQRLLNYEDFISAVDEVKVSGIKRTLQQIADRQAEVFSSERSSFKVAYLISDFQKNMSSSAKLAFDSGTVCRVIKLNAPLQPNIAVDSAWFISPVHKSGETERLVVRLKNSSGKPAENIPVILRIDGQQKALGRLSVPAMTTRTDTLSFRASGQGWKRGEVNITDYPVTFDDRYFFSYYVRGAMNLLVINAGEQSHYINAVYAAEPFFSVTNAYAGSLNYSEIFAYPLLILNGTTGITPGLAGQLKGYVQNGGTLLIFPSVEPGLNGLKALTRVLGTDSPQGIAVEPAKVSNVNYRHQLFKGVFEKIPRNADLPVAKKYILYSRSGQVRGSSVMDLQAGRTFLGQYRSGKGTILLSAVALSEESSNLVRHSFFVPLMYQSAFVSLHDKSLSYTIGKDSYFEINRVSLPGSQFLKLKNQKSEIIPDIRQTESGTQVFVADQIREAGQYTLFKGDSLLAVTSFNDDREESDLTYLTESELKDLFSKKTTEFFEPGNGPLKNTVKAINNGVQLWKLCLILALIFLAAEILLLRFYGGKNADGLRQGT